MDTDMSGYMLNINHLHQSFSYCKCCFAINGGNIWLAGCQSMLCVMP